MTARTASSADTCAAAAAISAWTCALSAFIFGRSSRIVAIWSADLNPHELAHARHLHAETTRVTRGIPKLQRRPPPARGRAERALMTCKSGLLVNALSNRYNLTFPLLLMHECHITSTVLDVVNRVQRILPAAVMLALAAAVGSVVAIRAEAAGHASAPSAASAPPPISPAMARRLPSGTFYFLAGANNISSNIWKASGTGTETELTHNGRNFGISNFGASTAGVVMGDGPAEGTCSPRSPPRDPSS